MIKAALFDLDGVVLDTESQYTRFWGDTFRHYRPDEPGIEQRIKGMTLTQIYEACLPGRTADQQAVTQALYEFERNMHYTYITGFETFIIQLRQRGLNTAVVTSSNREKMKSVYEKCPLLARYFDRILTSEDFSKSKPDPDCYLKGAACFGLQPSECVGFEDSINGLRSVRAAGLYTIALATTNPAHTIAPLADRVINDFTEINCDQLDI